MEVSLIGQVLTSLSVVDENVIKQMTYGGGKKITYWQSVEHLSFFLLLPFFIKNTCIRDTENIFI